MHELLEKVHSNFQTPTKIPTKSLYCPSQSSTRTALTLIRFLSSYAAESFQLLCSNVSCMMLMPVFCETQIFTITCSMYESPIVEEIEDMICDQDNCKKSIKLYPK